MKKLDEPLNVFDLKPPTYKEITGVINKLKSSGSPCLHDQMSIIILKRCPILRTEIPELLEAILIHKKDSNMEPSNFRPITLQPVFAKIYSSLIRNKIYNFLLENQFIELNIQKGFWRAISRTIEHTELLSHTIKHAKNKQRQIIITLLDLMNAFGEVDHKLLLLLKVSPHSRRNKTINRSSHRRCSVRKGILINFVKFTGKHLCQSLFFNKIVTYITDPLIIDKGVLQGDCLSALLFNMIINTLIKTKMKKGSVVWGIIFGTRLRLKTGSILRTIRSLLRQPNKTANHC